MSSRAIEAVSPEELYNVVAGAASQDPSIVVASATRLKEMLGMYGTFQGLSEISARRDVPLYVRQQSIIQFKNSALNLWRNRRLMSDEQRSGIRSRTLTLLDETDDVISDCNKIIISKIARQDFPAKWPNLFQDLISSVDVHTKAFVEAEGSDMRSSLIIRRSLEVLNAVLKELAAVKMPGGIKLYGQLLEDLHIKFQSLYATLSTYLPTIDKISAFASSSSAEVMRLSHLAYKCLCKLAVWLWIRLGINDMKHMKPWLESFFDSSAVQLKQLTELRIAVCTALGTPSDKQPLDRNLAQSIDYLTRHVLQFGKFSRRLQQFSIVKFVSLNCSKDLVLYYWSKVVQATNGPPELIDDTQWAVFPVRFIVQAMAIFKESLGQWSPQKRGIAEESTLSKDFVEEAVKLLVTRFIPLNPKDLNAWLADPEEWVNVEDKDNEQWEYELRPCGERVLMTFTNQYEGYVVPLLVSTFNNVIAQPTQDLTSIVQKEALYCAIGRCAQRLKSVIPFQQWVSQYLTKEAKDTNPNFPIIKRRIAWVLGKWIADECAAPTADVWDILMHLLSDQGPGTDVVVRFTAASALKDCVDSIQFNEDDFLPHMPKAIAQLIELTAEADTIETKRKLTDSLNVVVERMGRKIVPYMEMIVNPIPALWMSAGDNWLYKASLLETVQKLIESSKENSGVLNVVTVPLIQECFSPSGISHLDEDGLKLWEAALQNAVTLESVNGGPSLLSLFPIVINLLSENLDLLGSITDVVRSYLVLDTPKLLQVHGVPLLNAFAKAMSQAIATNQKDLIISLELLVQLSPAQLWAEPIHLSGLFAKFMKALMEDKERTSVLTEYICLLARMAINDSFVLSQLISATASATSRPETELWNGVMDQWWRRFDNMSEPRYRKLTAMGVACLLTTGRHEVLERLKGEILNLWSDVFGEMKEALIEISEMTDEDSEQSTLSSLTMFWKDDGSALPNSLDFVKDTPEYNRWVEIYKSDPVEREKLTSFVAAKLQQTAQACGGIQTLETSYLNGADEDLLKQLKVELGF